MANEKGATAEEKIRKNIDTLDPTVSCDVCLKEIPASVALKTESEDYVLYFCGLDCFDKWNKGSHKSEGK